MKLFEEFYSDFYHFFKTNKKLIKIKLTNILLSDEKNCCVFPVEVLFQFSEKFLCSLNALQSTTIEINNPKIFYLT